VEDERGKVCGFGLGECIGNGWRWENPRFDGWAGVCMDRKMGEMPLYRCMIVYLEYAP